MMYRIRWEIDVDAANKVEAAKRALEMQRDESSTAVIFEVRDSNKSEDDFEVIDLLTAAGV